MDKEQTAINPIQGGQGFVRNYLTTNSAIPQGTSTFLIPQSSPDPTSRQGYLDAIRAIVREEIDAALQRVSASMAEEMERQAKEATKYGGTRQHGK